MALSLDLTYLHGVLVRNYASQERRQKPAARHDEGVQDGVLRGVGREMPPEEGGTPDADAKAGAEAEGRGQEHLRVVGEGGGGRFVNIRVEDFKRRKGG